MVLATLEGDRAKAEVIGLIDRAQGDRAVIYVISTNANNFASLSIDLNSKDRSQ